MSAAAQQQSGQKQLPKVLRIGIIQEGKVAERLIRSGDVVSVGDGPRATFTFNGHGLGMSHGLFVPSAGSYALVVPESVDGKISWKDGIRDLSDLRARGEMHRKGEFWTLQLNENIRGKIVLGGTTLLFQFVNAPPEPVRAVSPADFRPRMFNDDDPLFLGLTGVFNAIAVLFYIAVSLSPPVEDNGLDQMKAAADLFPDKKPEVVDIKITVPDVGKTEDTKPDVKKPDTKADAAPKPKSEATAETVTKKSLVLQRFGTAGQGSDDLAQDILGDEMAMAGRLDSAMDGVTGTEMATGSNVVGLAGGGAGGKGDQAVGITDASGGVKGTEVAKVVVKRPKAEDIESGDPETDQGNGALIFKVVRSYRGGVESCVQKALRLDPSTNGRVAVGWKIVNGKVSDAILRSNSTHNDDLGKCVVKVVRSMRFAEDYVGEVDEYAWGVSGVE